PPVVRVPNFAGAVERSGGQPLAVGAEGELVDPICVSVEAGEELSLRVRHLDGATVVGAYQAFPLGVVGHAPIRSRVVLEREFLLPGGHVPDADYGVSGGAGRQPLAVGAEGRAISPAGMSGQRSEQHPGTGFEEKNGVPTGDSEQPAVAGL